MGRAGRQVVVERWSLEQMVAGYEHLVTEIYTNKCSTIGPQDTAPSPERSQQVEQAIHA